MLAEFHFIRPYWLLALLPAIVMLVLLLKHKLGRGNWTEVCDEALLPYLLQDKPVQQSRWSLTAVSMALLLTIVALAGPTWERLPSPVFRNESALVIALDLSRTMDAADLKPSRLSRARYKIADILKRRKDGQTALLVYAGDAFTVTPLTNDTETIASQLNALRTDIMPGEGRNTQAALKLASELLRQAGLRRGQILLISDGIDEKSPEQAESLGSYRLSVLGVGTAEGAPIKVAGGGFWKDEDGNIAVPKLDAAQLAALASAGGGIYRSISSDDSDIEALLAALDQPRTGANNDNPLFLDQWDEKGPWLLLLVLPLAALSFRKGLLVVGLCTLLPFPQPSHAFEWQDLWRNTNQQAQQSFKQQRFEQAAQQFDSPAWKAAAQYKAGQYQQAAETLQHIDSADAHYNRGNALAKTGQLKQALEAYQQALTLNPNNEDAKHNKEVVEKALQQQQRNQQQGDDSQQSNQDQSQQGQQERQGGQGQSEQQNQDQQQDSNGEPGQDQNTEQSEQASESESQSSEAEQSSEQQAQANRENQQSSESDQQASEQQAQPAEQNEMDENKQASEQWLNRIPDDPAGLLKRKFRYQYGQRRRKQQDQRW